MPRIISGSARGRRLQAPPGEATRPTSDRAREGLFSSLQSELGAWVGLHVVDLFAGSGAVGLEAASRGAASVVLVENDARAARTLRANADVVGLPGVRVEVEPVERFVETVVGPPFAVVFADPPYATDDRALAAILERLHERGALSEDALVVVERATRGGSWIWPEGFVGLRERTYGEGTLWYGRATATGEVEVGDPGEGRE